MGPATMRNTRRNSVITQWMRHDDETYAAPSFNLPLKLPPFKRELSTGKAASNGQSGSDDSDPQGRPPFGRISSSAPARTGTPSDQNGNDGDDSPADAASAGLDDGEPTVPLLRFAPRRKKERRSSEAGVDEVPPSPVPADAELELRSSEVHSDTSAGDNGYNQVQAVDLAKPRTPKTGSTRQETERLGNEVGNFELKAASLESEVPQRQHHKERFYSCFESTEAMAAGAPKPGTLYPRSNESKRRGSEASDFMPPASAGAMFDVGADRKDPECESQELWEAGEALFLCSSSPSMELDAPVGLPIQVDLDPWRLRPFAADRPFFNGGSPGPSIDVLPPPAILSELRLVCDRDDGVLGPADGLPKFKLQAVRAAAEQPLR